MNAAKQAKIIQKKLDKWPIYRDVRAVSPLVSELPHRDAPNRFGIIINLVIRPECLTLRSLFNLTVETIRWLRDNNYLRSFEETAIRVFSAGKGEPERILIFNADVTAIDDIPITSPEVLLLEINNPRCNWYWYCDKNTINT
jgi:hypothetical protein